MRLKPHEAQSYRKKALWVSWVSIVITIILAIAAFSEYAHRFALFWGGGFPSSEPTGSDGGALIDRQEPREERVNKFPDRFHFKSK